MARVRALQYWIALLVMAVEGLSHMLTIRSTSTFLASHIFHNSINKACDLRVIVNEASHFKLFQKLESNWRNLESA